MPGMTFWESSLKANRVTFRFPLRLLVQLTHSWTVPLSQTSLKDPGLSSPRCWPFSLYYFHMT